MEYVLEESCSSDIAGNVADNILNAVKKLEDFTELGVRLEEFAPFHSDYRMLVVDNYLVFYRVDDDEVFIDRILHSRRNYMRILFGER